MSLFLLSMNLTGCDFEEGDDLDQYMRDATKDVKPKVKPLPEVLPYMALQYNADGTLVDPFRARKAANKSGVLQPNLNRPREPMEAYPLESLKYVGMLSKSKMTYALLKTPDESVQQVKLGSYVGQNFGRVTKIEDGELVLTEIVQDDLTGDWVERVSSLTLQEQ
ncbi:MAG: pilus assembly protein PilP [Methylotenera sp.]|uniref:pilus assembly protein PilP n=1 Tax=Methylotenera sp. TaxID=2051956 RepID=UPI000D42EB76|nr:pilus assembly protein PilP [Methylotenera sp.]PPC80531.1 MAG: pilus assembly protein PilP [Methylotenera sp.]